MIGAIHRDVAVGKNNKRSAIIRNNFRIMEWAGLSKICKCWTKAKIKIISGG